jgi:DNA-binding transcriptional ArsR family regulator
MFMASNENQIRLKAKVFYALSDHIRLEILEYLRNGEKCVCEIVPYLNLLQPVISRHLKILKDSGLIKCRKDGTKRLYSVVDMRIYTLIDDLSSEFTEALKSEMLRQMTCQ